MANDTFKIALADDHPILREVLKKALTENSDIEVIGDVGDGIALINLLGHSAVLPDMVILDVSMPLLDGPEIARCIRELFPKIKILMFTMHAEADIVSQAFKAGADGYLLKEENARELFAAIHAIRRGKIYRSPRLEFTN